MVPDLCDLSVASEPKILSRWPSNGRRLGRPLLTEDRRATVRPERRDGNLPRSSLCRPRRESACESGEGHGERSRRRTLHGRTRHCRDPHLFVEPPRRAGSWPRCCGRGGRGASVLDGHNRDDVGAGVVSVDDQHPAPRTEDEAEVAPASGEGRAEQRESAQRLDRGSYAPGVSAGRLWVAIIRARSSAAAGATRTRATTARRVACLRRHEPARGPSSARSKAPGIQSRRAVILADPDRPHAGRSEQGSGDRAFVDVCALGEPP